MNPREHNGHIINSRNLLNESNSIPRIILLNERKDRRVTFPCLNSGPSHFVCGIPSLALPKASTGGGWNSSRPTANLRERLSEIKRGRKASEEKERAVINVNDAAACMAITV